MVGNRLKVTLRLWMIRTGRKRAEYLKKHNIYGAIGEGCTIMNRTVPLYSKLIKIGDNVCIASNVTFITHDIIHKVLNAHPGIKMGWGGVEVMERLGCIEVKDHVFIGAGAMILCNVRIGSNVIIGAGSLVNKDIPDNSVAAGVPARVVGSFDNYVERYVKEEMYPAKMKPSGEMINDELVNYLWDRFEKCRNKNLV